MIALVVALAVAATTGWLRPRWSSLSGALIPAAFAFTWLLLHEDIPGDPITFADVLWYIGMSLVAGAAFALACLLGIVARRFRSRRARLSL